MICGCGLLAYSTPSNTQLELTWCVCFAVTSALRRRLADQCRPTRMTASDRSGNPRRKTWTMPTLKSTSGSRN